MATDRKILALVYWHTVAALREGKQPDQSLLPIRADTYKATLELLIREGVFQVALHHHHAARLDRLNHALMDEEYREHCESQATAAGAPPRRERH